MRTNHNITLNVYCLSRSHVYFLTNFAKVSPFILHMVLKLVCTREVSFSHLLPPYPAYPKSPPLFLGFLRHTRAA